MGESLTLEILILFFTAVAAFWAAYEARKAANETRKAAWAEIISQIRNAYALPEMLEGMQKLRDWKQNHGSDWAGEFARLRGSNYDSVKREDEARRRFAHLFHLIRILLDAKTVDENFVRKVIQPDEVEFLLEIIEPMERAMNPENYVNATFDTFRRTYRTEATSMADEDDRFWQYFIAWVVLIFAIYPMTKDYIDNQANTITAMYFAIFFAGIVMVIAYAALYVLKKRK